MGHLIAAVRALGCDDEWHVIDVSPVYETEAVGAPEGIESGPFLNAAVILLTSLGGEAILERLIKIEGQAGRIRSVRNAPRTIDLDLLWIEGERINLPHLVVPHPRLAERPFMLRPLLDLAEDARDGNGNAFCLLPNASTALKVYPFLIPLES